MPYELFLALRHLRSGLRRGFARVTAVIAVVGTTCGVAALIIAAALANGFQDELQKKILSGTAHITLLRLDHEPIKHNREVIARVRSVAGVVDAAATTYDGALLIGPTSAAYAVLRGVDAESPVAISELRRTLVAGDATALLHAPPPPPLQEQQQQQRRATDDPRVTDQASADATDDPLAESGGIEVVIGAELAARLDLQVADEAQLIVGARNSSTPSAASSFSSFANSSSSSSRQNNSSGESLEANSLALGAAKLKPQYAVARVAGIFRSGLYEYDATWVYVSLPAATLLTGTDAGASTAISIQVADIFTAPEVAERVRAAVGGGLATIDWQQANRPLFAALELERRTVAVIIGLILLLAALNITATLVLLVVERRGDIAVLGTLGATRGAIMIIFVLEGAVIGLCGVLSGTALGLVACLIGNYLKVVRLPADVYSISSVPLHPRAADVLLASAVALVVSLLATLYPAHAATRVRPAQVLRGE